MDIPCHIEEQFQIVAGHLRVVHIGNPYLPYLVIVCLTHLVVDKSGLGGGQPQVVMWSSPITQMIIDTATALA